jgi:secreted Zn-dependent insulinase-like peptidase
VSVLFQIGIENVADTVALELLVQAMQVRCSLARMHSVVFGQEQAYDIMRTKQQLGYIVCTEMRKTCGTHGLWMIIQGGRHPRHVESRMEAFLIDLRVRFRQ